MPGSSSLPSMEIGLKIREIEDLIRNVAGGRDVVVAFSGGNDSTLALAVTLRAGLSPRAVFVDYGIFTYRAVRPRVKEISRMLQTPLDVILYPEDRFIAFAYRGVSCSRCTRNIKLGTILSRYPESLVITGSNQSDSFGKSPTHVVGRTFAPLKDLTKGEILAMLDWLGIPRFSLGVHPVREGCKLAHLWKPDLGKGYAVMTVVANDVLLDSVRGFDHHLANVKICGTARRTFGIVNVLPAPPGDVRDRVMNALERRLPGVGFVWGDEVERLTVVVNPSLAHNPEGVVFTIREGMMAHVDLDIIPSKEDFVRVFQVVDWR